MSSPGMRPMPIRGPSQAHYGHQLNTGLSTMPSSHPSQVATIPSHGALPSPIPFHHPRYSQNGSSGRSPPHAHLSSSLETLEAPVEDHMNWSPPSSLLSTPNTSDASANSSDSDTLSPCINTIKLSDLLPLPTSSPGPLTHAHQVAMAHRVTYDKLMPGGAFDPALYTPVFLHDTLMLPGSLATLLGKDSPLDILDRLTPARLPSFTLTPNTDSPSIPCLLPSSSSSSSATGLLLLGTGRDARKAIKAHYRPVAKRTRHKVAIEVKVPVPLMQRASGKEAWRLESRWLEAQVFVWRGARGEESSVVKWELGAAISGAYDSGDGEIEVVEAWGGGEDGGGESEGEWEVGDLRLDGKSEWAGDVVWCGSGREVDVRRIEW